MMLFKALWGKALSEFQHVTLVVPLSCSLNKEETFKYLLTSSVLDLDYYVKIPRDDRKNEMARGLGGVITWIYNNISF